MAEEFRHEQMWDWELPRSNEEIFLSRIEGVSMRDMQEGGDQLFEIQLPCGHRTSIRKVEIAMLTGNARKTQLCPICSTHIFQPEDLEDLERWRGFSTAERYRADNAIWKGSDDYLPNSKQNHTIPARHLLEALDTALATLDTPEPFVPAAMNAHDFSETQAIKQQFHRLYGDSNAVITTSQLDLYRELYRAATHAPLNAGSEVMITNSVTPEDYGSFLQVWLLRAIGVTLGLLELDATADDDDEDGAEFRKDLAEVEGRMGDVTIA